jgi:SAM-dependent methyltransferase
VVSEFEPDRYEGECRVCGRRQVFERELLAIRETYRCVECRASLREREQAATLLQLLGAADPCLADFVRNGGADALDIYEPGTTGPFRPLFQGLPGYRQSCFYPEAERASSPPSVPHQDLEALDFGDASFDLVISSDILEHVRRPRLAFAEVARVLKPGGLHVFTVPMQSPFRDRSVARVDVSGDEDVELLPARYHGNGRGGRSLVYTDFGLDILEMLAEAGTPGRLVQPESASELANRVATVVGAKPGR